MVIHVCIEVRIYIIDVTASAILRVSSGGAGLVETEVLLL